MRVRLGNALEITQDLTGARVLGEIFFSREKSYVYHIFTNVSHTLLNYACTSFVKIRDFTYL